MLENLKGKDIKLIALDLDGTLFLPNGTISEKNKEAIKKAVKKGIHVCLSSGRPLAGLPKKEALELGIEYAITTNGSSVYRLTDDKLIGESPLDCKTAVDILDSIADFEITRDAYIDGKAKSAGDLDFYLNFLDRQGHLTKGLKDYLIKTRSFVGDLSKYIKENNLKLQKFTFNFLSDDYGNFISRDDVEKILRSRDDITVVTGGYGDLEVTAKGIDKANGIKILCETLGIDKANAMAIGDSENDLAMITYSGVGVAMANSEDIILENADYITFSCIDDGVAYAIEQVI
ncbi:MAG: Cof-type HAD-IIB family hydrolase [Lachnospiraceae bacterium]|nr:Cof-type HAD-IIB family hydrolase [Lachnospiraceae bacterium]